MALDNMIANSYYNRGTSGQSGFYRPKDGNYTSIFPKERKKTSTTQCKIEALNALSDFHDFSMVSHDTYKEIKKKIESATCDDDVSLIMSKLRKNIFT